MPQLATSPPQLKWHNTIPQHFSTRLDAAPSNSSPSRRTEKRPVVSTDGVEFRPAGDIKMEDESNVALEHSLAESLSSNNKRLKASVTVPKTTTPVKQTSTGAVPPSAGSLQTPPPTATKKRGRPPKTSQRQPGSPLKRSNTQSQNKSQVTTRNHGEETPKATKTVKSSKRLEGRIRQTLSTPNRILPVAPVDDIFTLGSSFLDKDFALGWSTCGETDYSGDLGADLFMRSDIEFDNPLDPMALSFNCNTADYEERSSINPSLLFSSRPTSDVSSLLGGYTDETDILSSSSQSNEQPYQHQLEYSRREQATGFERASRCKMKPVSQGILGSSRKSSLLDIDSRLRRTISENVLADITRERRYMVASSSSSGSRSNTSSTRSRGSGRQTPPPRVRNTVRLLISPSGRARTVTKVVYEDSDTEPDEPNEAASVNDSADSDYSIGENILRGSSPGGRLYNVVKKAKGRPRDESARHVAPKLGFFSSAPMPDFTPSSASALPPASGNLGSRGDTALQSIQSTPKKYGSRFLDECILSSPKLPTPLKCTSASRQAMSFDMSGSLGGLEMDSRLTSRPPFYLGDESEAETVTDEVGFSSCDEEQDHMNDVEKDDAVFALRSVVAKRRGLPIDSPALTSVDTGEITKTRRKRVKARGTQNMNAHSLKMVQVSDQPSVGLDHLTRRRASVRAGNAANYAPNSLFTSLDISLASTDRVENLIEGEAIRCLCGVTDDGGATMVQCDLCKNWLHISCTGLNTRQLPKRFACQFCGGGIIAPHGAGLSKENSVCVPQQQKIV